MNTSIPRKGDTPSLDGHSAVYVKGQIVCFYEGKVDVYHIGKRTWSTPILSGDGPVHYIEHHTANIIKDELMIVLGGYGTDGTVKYLCLKTFKWRTVQGAFF